MPIKHRDAGDHAAEPRVYMQDVIPYEVPERLEDLHGPARANPPPASASKARLVTSRR